MRIGCVIVTHQSAGHIASCLDALNATGLFESGAVLVVDNASTDETVHLARQLKKPVKIFDSGKNTGFAGAANLGFRTLQADYILLLNPDVEVIDGITAMADACERTGAAACGGQLLGTDGRPQRGFQIRRFPKPITLAFEVLGLNRLWPENSINRQYRYDDLDINVECMVEQPAGAFLLIRRKAWEEIGGFDESFYPLWFEDVDFAYRLNQSGQSVIYSPLAVGKHTGGHSVMSLRWGPRQLYWYSNLLRFAAKHYAWRGRCLVSSSILVGCLPRALMGIMSQRSFSPLSVYGRIVFAACMSLLFRTVPGDRNLLSVAQVSKEAGV